MGEQPGGLPVPQDDASETGIIGQSRASRDQRCADPAESDAGTARHVAVGKDRADFDGEPATPCAAGFEPGACP
jgi:hypothetical protein